MTLQQLRYLCEIVRHDLNISSAADALRTSQPGISQQIKTLEAELGTTLLVRSRKRLVGLTQAGQAILPLAQQAVAATRRIRETAREFASPDTGELTVATTHTYARYLLLEAIAKFVAAYPGVKLRLRQGNAQDIAQWVRSGEVELGVTAEPTSTFPGLVLLPCYTQHRILLARAGHPFLRERSVTLSTIAKYPMIAYDSSLTGKSSVERTFTEAQLKPHVIVSTTDADVMKAYVKRGLGIAVVAENVYEAAADKGLRVVDVGHLFKSTNVCVCVHKDVYLRSFTCAFITLFAPRLTKSAVQRALKESGARSEAGKEDGASAAVMRL